MEELEQIVSSEEDRRWCVYIHRNKINNKAYIGTTQQNPKRRWQNGYGYKNNSHFWRAIEKYGWNNFEHIIFADYLSQNDASHIEKLLISLYNTTNHEYGYNISAGGDCSHFGIPHSEKTKQVLREKTKERLSISENHPMYGKRHTEESKKKMSNTKTNPPKEVRQKMSEAKLGTFCDDDANQLPITICQYDKQGNKCNEFFGVSFASDQTGISRSAIANCLCRLSHTAGGYIWRRSNEVLTKEDVQLANNSRRKSNENTKNTSNKIVRYEKYYDKQKKKWRARIVNDNKYKYLGAFLTEEEADNAILECKNNFRI